MTGYKSLTTWCQRQVLGIAVITIVYMPVKSIEADITL